MALLAVAAYLPPRHVLQEDLEAAHGCPGKYTRGLGQRAMAVAAAGDDPVSMAKTALERLLRAAGRGALRGALPRVRRLEVATESRLDRAKSVKSELSELAAEHGVPRDTSGCDVTNACIGGVQALLDTAEFVRARDRGGEDGGAYGIVVTTDVAEYRLDREVPTGGAGALALLLGPPSRHPGQGLLLPDARGALWHWEDARDFAKPHLADCMPQVDGPGSVRCYLEATERVLQPAAWREARFCCYHAPFSKMAQKGHLRLWEAAGEGGLRRPEAAEDFAARALPALRLTKLVGNIYTGSLPLCLAAVANLLRPGQTAYCSGYGSGAAACSFEVRSAGPVLLGEELRPYLEADPEGPAAPALPGRISVARMEALCEERRALAAYCLRIDPLVREVLAPGGPDPGDYEVPLAEEAGAGDAWVVWKVLRDGRRVYGRGELTSSAGPASPGCRGTSP